MKEYGLALGGGGAKGVAHIGVIKYIEENNIIINEIAGTSMGSIIGACLALGFDSKKMEEIISEINFLKLVDLNLKNSIVSGKKVYKKLEEIFGNIEFKNLKIPLKIITCDYDTGEKTVFSEGKLIDAIRASISIPWVFEKYNIGEHKYIDGGLSANLPINELSGNNVIAVSAIRGDLGLKNYNKIANLKIKKSIFGHTYNTIKTTIVHMMCTNEDLNIQIAKNNGKNIIFIGPDLAKYEIYDFLKYKEIINVGYNHCKSNIKL